jgi:N-acyl-D-aspartate/D-glutamate deacylase
MPATRSRSCPVARTGCRGRVVQLVREVRRQGAEPGEVLGLAQGRLADAHADVQPVEQVHRQREPSRMNVAKSPPGSRKNALATVVVTVVE